MRLAGKLKRLLLRYDGDIVFILTRFEKYERVVEAARNAFDDSKRGGMKELKAALDDLDKDL